MKALILAAGRGSRMGNETSDAPKCFVKLGGKRLIEWQKEALRNAGVEEIVAVGGYRHEKLTEYVDVAYLNERWEETNSVRSLLSARPLLSNYPCIISYSDIIYRSNHVKKLAETSGSITITFDEDWLQLWSMRSEDPLSDAETFAYDGSRLIEIGKRPSDISEVSGQYMGLIHMTPRGWRRIEHLLCMFSQSYIDKLDITALLSILLENDVVVNVVKVKGGWCEVDTIKDRDAYETMLKDPNWKHDWRR